MIDEDALDSDASISLSDFESDTESDSNWARKKEEREKVDSVEEKEKR